MEYLLPFARVYKLVHMHCFGVPGRFEEQDICL